MHPELPPRIHESLKALCCLALSERPLRAPEVAAAAALPPTQTAKILQQMTWAGFVESRRGTKGGFRLLKSPARIRVTDVIAFFTHPTPERELTDPVMRAFARANKRYMTELSRITIADVAKLAGRKTARSKGRRKPSVKQEFGD